MSADFFADALEIMRLVTHPNCDGATAVKIVQVSLEKAHTQGEIDAVVELKGRVTSAQARRVFS